MADIYEVCFEVFNSLKLSDPYMHQETNHDRRRYWLVIRTVPSHYLNKCWDIINWKLGNKLQLNLNQNLYIFIQENAFENVIWNMARICLGLNVLKGIWYVVTLLKRPCPSVVEL